MPRGDFKKIEIQFSNSIIMPEIVNMLNEGHTVTLRLRGYSMQPFLEDGRDKALLKKPVTIKNGDPVLAEISKGMYVLHRIIKMEGNSLILRGDGNISTEVCHISDIKGIAIGFYRKGRDKIDLTDGIKWRIYSFFWTALFPLRRYLLFLYRHCMIKRYFPNKNKFK